MKTLFLIVIALGLSGCATRPPASDAPSDYPPVEYSAAIQPDAQANPHSTDRLTAIPSVGMAATL